MSRLRPGLIHRFLRRPQLKASYNDIPETMKCIVQKGYGEVESSLAYANVPVPQITAHDVLVKVKAASLNMIDCKLRYGFGKSILDNRCEVTSEGHMKGPPFIVGRDFSGEIVSVGPSVPDLPEFELGSAVLGHIAQLTAQGSWSEYVRVPYWDVVQKPDYFTFEEASGISFQLAGAIELLSKYGYSTPTTSEDNIVILGGGTGGSIANTLALLFKIQGIDPHVFTFSEKDNLERFNIVKIDKFSRKGFIKRAARANSVFLPNGISNPSKFHEELNYEKLSNHIKKVTSTSGNLMEALNATTEKVSVFQLVAEGLQYADYLEKIKAFDKKSLRNYITIHHQKKLEWELVSPQLALRQFLVEPSQMSIYPRLRSFDGHYIGQRNILDAIQAYIKEFTPLNNMSSVDTIFPFSKAFEAHQRMDDGEYNGKLVISMNELEENSPNLEKLEYTDYNQLAHYYIPSDTIYPLLRSGKNGKIQGYLNRY